MSCLAVSLCVCCAGGRVAFADVEEEPFGMGAPAAGERRGKAMGNAERNLTVSLCWVPPPCPVHATSPSQSSRVVSLFSAVHNLIGEKDGLSR
jgi:hypothetical protein